MIAALWFFTNTIDENDEFCASDTLNDNVSDAPELRAGTGTLTFCTKTPPICQVFGKIGVIELTDVTTGSKPGPPRVNSREMV
jgi:hypothetical protein